jgi:hypothetical protein
MVGMVAMAAMEAEVEMVVLSGSIMTTITTLV